MHAFKVLSLALLSIPTTASVLPRRDSASPRVQQALYDGQCFYPTSAPSFNLSAYLGTWYQVAGTPFGPTAGARCIAAQYSLNGNGTIKVVNTATVRNASMAIEGTATPADSIYGASGVFRVQFPGQPAPSCRGGNYIVQDFCDDFAIVQTQNWTTLYILSRERVPEPARVNDWIERAAMLGSDRTRITKVDQKEC